MVCDVRAVHTPWCQHRFEHGTIGQQEWLPANHSADSVVWEGTAAGREGSGGLWAVARGVATAHVVAEVAALSKAEVALDAAVGDT